MAALDLIEWDAPGPYRVVFSTRAGGVSEGAFASLNLGIRTEDDPACVVENRRLLCEAVDADPDGATMAWQRHGATITRAEPRGVVTPGTVYEHCDGLWTDEPGRAMLLLTADCLPVALVRTDGRAGAGDPPHRLARAARRHRRRGRPRARVRPVRAAVIGPSIGPCCYEVGDEVAAPFREAFGGDVVRESHLDLWTCAERALRAAGCARVERLDECTSCNGVRFFSHRRDEGRTGRQGVIAYVT